MTSGLGDFSQSLERLVIARRRRHVDRFGVEALAWLALPPVWTEELATELPFPQSPFPLPQFLAECTKLGWCVQRPASVTARPEDAADLLVRVLGQLRSPPAGSAIKDKITEAAVAAINQIKAPRYRQLLRDRLSEIPGLSEQTMAQVGAITPSTEIPAAPGAIETASLLIAHNQLPELDGLLRGVRVGDLQQILATTAGIPAYLLAIAIRRVVAECPPSAAAKLLTMTAPELPPELVVQVADELQQRIGGERGGDATMTNLAIALVSVGDQDKALAISERVADDRLRARALSALAAAAAADRGGALLASIVERIARVIVEGDGVNLPGVAEAVTRLARADALSAAQPVIEIAYSRLNPSHLLAADVGALVSISAELRDAGDHTGDAFAEAAVAAAMNLGDPATRAAGLARVLPIVDERRGELMAEALDASRAVIDAIDRADAFARLVPHAGPRDLDEVISEVVASVRPIDPGKAFWVPDNARDDILDELQGQGLPWLRQTALDIAKSVLSVEPPGLVPTTLRRWATLAVSLVPADEAGNDAGDALLRRVQPLLGSGDVAEALDWIETGRQLLRVVHGSFDTSLLVASRLVELAQRRANDQRLLKRFLPRDEQTAAFRRLLQVADGQEPWALHYLGDGGVGKTMLLRHITAELGPAADRIVARIDFDHLNPEFPLRRPGQLLLDILEELEVFADSGTRPLYEEASLFLRHQEWWRRGIGADDYQGTPPAALSQAVQRFCAYVLALRRPVVLILDTCEELAKFQPVGAVLPQLDAAFGLLERIYADVPSLRVVLAGRRPLARTVHGGRSLRRGQSQARVPAAKTYLAVQEVAGFNETEARRYLSEMEGLTLDEGTTRDLLDRSREAPHRPWYARDPSDVYEPRCVPFDLAQYATVLRDNPAYLTEHPRSHAYVRDRIIRRQGRLSQRLLPAAVLMRRFDRDMLRAASPDVEPVLDEVWREFATTEWVSTHVDAALNTTFLEIDRAMLERLADYYREPEQRAEYEGAKQLVADGLDHLVRTRALRGLTVDPVDAALRCLPEDRATTLCDTLTLRVAREGGAWMWAYNVFSRVLGIDGALGIAQHKAAASATALYATALSQIQPAGDYRPQWKAVADQAVAHPRQLTRRWLQARADVLANHADTAGWQRAMRLVGELLAGDEEDHRRAAWLVGTVLAAAARVVDAAASGRHPTGAADWESLGDEHIGQRFGPQVSAITTVLLARGLQLDSDATKAAELFTHALAIAATPAATGLAPEAAADGGVPRHPCDRVRLEALLSGLTGTIPDEWLWQAVDTLTERARDDQSSDADSDRLASALLNRWLDQRPVAEDLLERIQQVVGRLPPPTATIYAHRLVPPLRVTLSRGWLALGRRRQARSALGPRGTFAATAGEQQLLDMARVEIARRLRLTKSDTAVRAKLKDSLPLVQAARVHETATLLGDPQLAQPDLPGIPEKLHIWWRVNPDGWTLADDRDVVASISVAPDWCAQDQPQTRAALTLDAAELRYMQDGPSAECDRQLAGLSLAPPDRQRLDQSEDTWRMTLRRAALNTNPRPELERLGPDRENPPADVLRPGLRRLAELALEEGELLALRLPEPGACLLDAAASWFRGADDTVGTLIAFTAARLADARAGRLPRTGELEQIYQYAQQSGAELPNWSDLQGEARRFPTAGPAPWRTRSAWEGWLLRLTWLLAWPDLAGRRVLDAQATIPPELRPAKPLEVSERHPRQSVAPRTFAQLEAAYADRALSRSLRRKVLLSGGTAAATLAALVVYGLFLRVPGTLLVIPEQPLRIAVYVLALLSAVPAVVLFVTSGSRYNSAQVVVTSGRHPDTAEITARSIAERRWPLPPRVRSANAVVSMTGNRVPESGITTSVHRTVAAVARRRFPLRVSLSVARRVADVAWERWLAAPLEQPPDLYMERFYQRYLGFADETVPPDGTYWVLAPRRWESLVMAAMLAMLTDQVTWQVKCSSGFPRRAAAHDVIVVVATAIGTRAGRRLVVQQGDSPDDDLILEPDGTAALGANVMIVGEPRRGRSLLSAAESAAALRECAADLVQAGVEVAVVVPSTSAHHISQILTMLVPILQPGLRPADKDQRVHSARQVLASATDPSFGYELTVMRRL